MKDYKSSLAGFDRLVTQTAAFQDKRELMQAYLYRAEVKARLNDLDGAGKDWSNARDLAAEIKAPDDDWKLSMAWLERPLRPRPSSMKPKLCA